MVIISRSSIFCSRFDFLGNLFRPTGLYGPSHTTLKCRVQEVPLEARLLIILSLQYLYTRYHVRITEHSLSFFITDTIYHDQSEAIVRRGIIITPTVAISFFIADLFNVQVILCGLRLTCPSHR